MSLIKKILTRIELYMIELQVKKELAIMNNKSRLGLLLEKNGNWLDESFKYVLAVVIGLAFLAGLYTITKDTILPTLSQKIKDGFNFSG